MAMFWIDFWYRHTLEIEHQDESVTSPISAKIEINWAETSIRDFGPPRQLGHQLRGIEVASEHDPDDEDKSWYYDVAGRLKWRPNYVNHSGWQNPTYYIKSGVRMSKHFIHVPREISLENGDQIKRTFDGVPHIGYQLENWGV